VQPQPDPRPLLRLEVGGLRRRESRRVFDPSVHVGALGGPRRSFVFRAQDRPVMDRGLRVEVMCSLLDEREDDVAGAAVWLVRPGVPELSDLDLEWQSAAGFAFATRERRPAGFYVVTRTGWLDVRSGESRVWKRLRL
jgi:hypothetical protein